MARMTSLLALAWAVASCAQPGLAPQRAQTPAWLAERIAHAEAADRDYPSLADVPDYTPGETSYQSWRQGLAEMGELRQALLSDPALTEEEPDADAAAFARQSRAETERDIRRQTVDQND